MDHPTCYLFFEKKKKVLFKHVVFFTSYLIYSIPFLWQTTSYFLSLILYIVFSIVFLNVAPKIYELNAKLCLNVDGQNAKMVQANRPDRAKIEAVRSCLYPKIGLVQFVVFQNGPCRSSPKPDRPDVHTSTYRKSQILQL